MKKGMTVIFDMDGVIFDSERAILECWLVLADKYGLKNLEEVFKKCIGTNDAQTAEIVESAYAPEFGEGIYDKLRKESSEIFHKKYDGVGLPIKPGVKELLDYLKDNNVPIGLASSTKKATVERELTEAGLIDYFDKIIGGDAVKISKPNPEIYFLACEAMGTEPEKAIAIEDSYNGVRAAKAAGMQCIMVPDIIPADDEMRSLADAICGDLLEVKETLE
jgi:HAD superfamily hydrolase (TIGR01509 family)